MHQVFISYAHADDEPFGDAEHGWVTMFAEHLQKALRQQPGGAAVGVWMDHRLEPQKQLDAALVEQVAQAGCFVALMSPRYLESSYCRLELDTFVRRVGLDGRVFIVEMAPTGRDGWPSGTSSLPGMRFYGTSFTEAPMTLGWPVPLGNDKAYWRALNEISHFMAGTFRSVPVASNGRTVWLAEPTDHVVEYWEQLAGALRQHGCTPLPLSSSSYPSHAEADYRAALGQDLGRAEHFVQLLGPHPGRRPAWSQKPFALLQAQIAAAAAQARGASVLQWRAPDVAPQEVRDPEYAELVRGAVSGGFESFLQHVLAKVTAPPASIPAAKPPIAADVPLSVCVNADAPDREVGEHVRDLLFALGVDVNLAPSPAPDQPASRWREEYEAMLAECHGVVIVYGSTPASWVQAQVGAARKLLARTRRGTWGALLDAPPGRQPDHGVRSHSLLMLNCRDGLHADPLSRFVAALRDNAQGDGSNV